MRRLLIFLALGAAVLADDALPYPAGESEHVLEGSATQLMIPEGLSAEKPASLVVLLHGAGGTGPAFGHVLREWPRAGYVVVAPTAIGGRWDANALAAVKRIVAKLLTQLPIDKTKIHCIGYSMGGWGLGGIAFDDTIQPCSATWVGAGYRGASVPKWARKRLGTLAVAGANDPNARAAADTPVRLRDKVRSTEVRLEPGLAHVWPHAQMDYVRWWMGTCEGRFTPGEDRNFDWGESVEDAVAVLKDEKRGGVLVYYFDAEKDKDNPHAKRLQNEIFMDPAVRFFGTQLEVVKLAWTPDNKHGVKETPAVAVLKKDGTVKKILKGKITARSLASALRSVAPNRKRPK